MRVYAMFSLKKGCIKWHCVPLDTASLIVVKVGIYLRLCPMEEILLLNVLCHQRKEFLL